MKIELKKRITDLIDQYKATVDAYSKQILLVISDIKPNMHKYTPEGLQEELEGQVTPIVESWQKVDQVYNQKYKTLIEDAKGEFIKGQNGKAPADAPLKVANALHMIQMMDIDSDDKAYMILKEFVDARDYDNLKIFKQIIGQNIELEDANGESVYPKTFGDFNRHETIVNLFGDLQEIGTNMFLYKKANVDPETSIIAGGKAYGVPMDGYAQNVDELHAVSFGEHIDKILESVE